MTLSNLLRRRLWRVLIGVGIGILLIPPTMLLAFLSAGGGHGDYVWANGLFPYSMIVREWRGEDLARPNLAPIVAALALGLVQFPVYGGLIGTSASSLKKAVAVAALIGIVHAIAVTACFISTAWHEADKAPRNAVFVRQYDTDGDGTLNAEERRTAAAKEIAADPGEAGEAMPD